MLDALTRKMWLASSAKGEPPDPADVCRLQYKLVAHWHWRKYLFPMLRSIGRIRTRKHLYMRRVSRGGGKTKFIAFAHLYVCEYILPFIPDVQPENRTTVVIARTETLVKQDHMEAILGLIATGAPWLKTDKEDTWHDPEVVKAVKIASGTRTWNTTEFSLTNGCRILGFGFDQSVRGKHGFLITPDDIVNEENFHRALTPPGKGQMDEIQGAIIPAIEFGGAVLVTGTPQSESDMYQVLAEDPRWDSMDLPAWDEGGTLGYKEANEEDVASGLLDKSLFKRAEDWHCLFIQRYDYDQLMDERGVTRASHSKFTREYLLRPVADSTLLIHPNDLARAKDISLCYADSGVGAFYAGLDPSSLKRDEAAIVVIMVDEHHRRVPVYTERVKIRAYGETEAESFRRLFEAIRRVHRKFTPRWLVEDNGFQAVIKPFMQEEMPGIHMEGFHLGSNKHLEAVGWPMIRAIFEVGKMALPTGPTPAEAKAGVLESDWEAVRLTAELCRQLGGIRYIANRIEEDPRTPNDLVSAFHLALKCAETADGGASVSILAGRPLARSLDRKPRNPELPRLGGQGPLGRVAAAERRAASSRRGRI